MPPTELFPSPENHVLLRKPGSFADLVVQCLPWNIHRTAWKFAILCRRMLWEVIWFSPVLIATPAIASIPLGASLAVVVAATVPTMTVAAADHCFDLRLCLVLHRALLCDSSARFQSVAVAVGTHYITITICQLYNDRYVVNKKIPIAI